MKISWNWLSEWVDLKQLGTPQNLADLLTRRGLEVEEVVALSQGLNLVIAAKIIERSQHPNADRLSVCKVSTGRGDPIDIVCGAQNMKSGDIVALAQVGAHLPNGVKIERSKIRDVVSNGMLCSEDELKLSLSQPKVDGIIILPASTELGLPLAKVLGLDDAILDLKLTANRGDCQSHLGIAREVAAALGTQVKLPSFQNLTFSARSKSKIAVKLMAGEASPQFLGASIEGVKVGPSPEWLRKKLESVGSRSINNVVDVSNLVMLEFGHPVHIYDADRIEGAEIGVRDAMPGELLPLLDGTELKLVGDELVICDAKRAIGLAGVMGGGNSEVASDTRNVFLECAEFSPARVRMASSRYQKKTDAALRFEKGIDPQGLERVVSRLASLVLELAGGSLVGAFAERKSGFISGQKARKSISFSQDYFEKFLGFKSSDAEIEKTFRDLECEVEKVRATWMVSPPSYRLDLKLKEDLAEELARSVGYDRIAATIPPLSGMPKQIESWSERPADINRVKRALKDLGLQECVNFGFTSLSWLNTLGFKAGVKLLNPLSEEHEYLVPSLVPGLIKNALENERHHFGSGSPAIRLFEIRPTFQAPASAATSGEMATNVAEQWKMTCLLSGPRTAGTLKADQEDVDFSDLKAVLQGCFQAMGTGGVRFKPLEGGNSALAHLCHPGLAAEVWLGNQCAGVAGLLHPVLAKRIKARGSFWVAEVNWELVRKLSRSSSEAPTFKNWGEFPPMERDFALLVKSSVLCDQIVQLALKVGKPLAKSAKVFDIYQGEPVPEGMTSVAVRVIFLDETRSLQEVDAEAASAQILKAWKQDLGAELRS